MFIKKLEDLFYQENTHLIEVLDKDKHGNWNGNKTRGYGIAICDHKGLDFSKAVLLAKDSYISTAPFLIPPDAHKEILDKAHHIRKMFSKYVDRYVVGCQKNDENILRSYRFSTLCNYHSELGL